MRMMGLLAAERVGEPKDGLGWPATPGAINRGRAAPATPARRWAEQTARAGEGGSEAMAGVGGGSILGGDRGDIGGMDFSPVTTEEGTATSPGAESSAKSVEEIVAKYAQQMQENLDSGRQRDAAKAEAALASAMSSFSRVTNASLAARQAQITEVRERATHLETEQKAMREQIAVLQEKLGAHERGISFDASPRTRNNSWSVCLTIVKCTPIRMADSAGQTTLQMRNKRKRWADRKFPWSAATIRAKVVAIDSSARHVICISARLCGNTRGPLDPASNRFNKRVVCTHRPSDATGSAVLKRNSLVGVCNASLRSSSVSQQGSPTAFPRL